MHLPEYFMLFSKYCTHFFVNNTQCSENSTYFLELFPRDRHTCMRFSKYFTRSSKNFTPFSELFTQDRQTCMLFSKYFTRSSKYFTPFSELFPRDRYTCTHFFVNNTQCSENNTLFSELFMQYRQTCMRFSKYFKSFFENSMKSSKKLLKSSCRFLDLKNLKNHGLTAVRHRFIKSFTLRTRGIFVPKKILWSVKNWHRYTP